MPGKIRIIGGKWRSRKLSVADAPALRPTPDRVRETLFNWLSPWIEGAQCLDLYAGTGILGFEALSRGAGNVVMVELNTTLVNHLQQQAKTLDANKLEIHCADVPDWLKICNKSFDIVFIDPPYASDQTGNITRQLLNCGCLNPGALVYTESDHQLEWLAPKLHVIKKGRAGAVQFHLLKYTQDE